MKSYNIIPEIFVGNIGVEIVTELSLSFPVVVISSPSVSAIPKIKDFIGLLSARGEVVLYNSMRADAPFSCLDEILELISKKIPATIIAIGGGSVIDSSKAVAVSVSSEHSYKNYFNSSNPPPKRKVRLIAVPTTAGSGAELSFGAILFDDEHHIKSGIRGKELQPDQVILDFELYGHGGAKLIAEVGFDCLTHAVETYISTASSPIVRYQSIAAIRTVFDHLENSVRGDTTAMRSMAIASSLMGVNLALSSTCLPHRIQYVVGPKTRTSHAQGLIALYSGWLKLISKSTGPLDQLCDELRLTKSEFVENVNGLKKRLAIEYTLSQFGILRRDVDQLAESVTGNLKNDPYYNNTETLKEIIESSL